jgi:hypothetical protein
MASVAPGREGSPGALGPGVPVEGGREVGTAVAFVGSRVGAGALVAIGEALGFPFFEAFANDIAKDEQIEDAAKRAAVPKRAASVIAYFVQTNRFSDFHNRFLRKDTRPSIFATSPSFSNL